MLTKLTLHPKTGFYFYVYVCVPEFMSLQRPEKGAGATRTGVVMFVGHHVDAESEPASSE